MKSKIILCGFIIITHAVQSQQSTSFRVVPYFSAVIVKNIDSSVIWYETVLGLKARFLPDVPQGIKVAILESPDIVMEMIGNISWPDSKELLRGKPVGTRIQGLFKIGFKVTAMDNFIEHLTKLNILIPGIYKDASGKRNFLVEDPDKNLVQFFE
ncbi:MAG TPA: VOC family protein [Chitinophagaceae bacterium]|nr:VOC family protein [Chitinophagaceae bacterium]